jgi:hypothetical protein
MGRPALHFSLGAQTLIVSSNDIPRQPTTPFPCHRRLFTRQEIFPWWEHAAAEKFFAAAMTDLLRPVHPAGLAQAEKMPRRFIRRESQIAEPEEYHARSPVRPIENVRSYSSGSAVSCNLREALEGSHFPSNPSSVGSSLVQADLSHELREARVGAQGVGHRIDVQVDEAVDAFLEGKVEQAKGFVFFTKADVDSRGV